MLMLILCNSTVWLRCAVRMQIEPNVQWNTKYNEGKKAQKEHKEREREKAEKERNQTDRMAKSRH